VVAEGIEDAQTWKRLAAMGCDIAQGYYLGRPMPAAQLDHWLVENGAYPVGSPARAADVAEQAYAPNVTPLRASSRRRLA
jgi:predicted signal transduction protein with EAL and GGDEF domain